ncbi:MAG: hypothetical protein NVSMB13_04790 [Mycobacteriales bacterium]
MQSSLASLRAAGLLLGLGGAVVLLVWTRVPVGATGPGAGVRVLALSSGVVTARPAGAVLAAADLRPSGAVATASLDLDNIAAAPLALTITASASKHELDELLHVRVLADAATVYDGTLGGLQRSGVTLGSADSGHAVHLDLSVWLPAGTGGGYQGRTEDVTLAFAGSATGPVAGASR